MNSVEPGKKRRSHRGWWIAAGVVLLAAILIALMWLNGHWKLRRKIEQLRAKGYPMSIEELDQRRKLPEGTPNAADLYQKAFNAYQEPSKEDQRLLPFGGYADLPETGESLPNPMKEAIERFLDANEKTLELCHQAITIPDCSFSLLPSKSFEGIPILNENVRWVL